MTRRLAAWLKDATPQEWFTMAWTAMSSIVAVLGCVYWFGGQVAQAKADITDLQKADIAMQAFVIRESEKNDRSADEMKALIKEVRDNQFAMMQAMRVPTNERQR
jgi:hypothetical protein